MAPTPTIGADLTRRGFERVQLWSRGVNHALFRPRVERALDLPRPIFLYVGRVAVEKNLEALLGLDLPGSTVIVGDGPARAALERRYPHAHFLGERHGEALAEIYASADVFVFPSRTDTFGIVLIEAMASGLPVAAFPVPGPIDVVGPASGRPRRRPARRLPQGADHPARGGARILAALHLEGERAAVPRQYRDRPREAFPRCGRGGSNWSPMRSLTLIRALALTAALSSAVALAQESAPPPTGGMMMHGAAMTPSGDMTHGTPARAGSMPTEAGQGAFAAIQEIVAILEADPNTDWSKVDIDALRQHLVDMNAVTLEAKVANAPVEGGLRFDVTGDGAGPRLDSPHGSSLMRRR